MKECVGMLLAGGEGKRLGALTHHGAKPAVPFGGKYRIIDFTLSNCTNSGIQTLGVLTQYSPLELNRHIGNGEPWDMDRRSGGVTVLSPYTGKTGGDWYSGTADAIYQNIHFINQYDPEYVLVISGDHIYQMDYQKMLEQHKQTEADATVSVIEVPWGEASRFGILSISDSLRIFEFEEKPDTPQSNLASMGIYIFTWDKLKNYLLNDAQNKDSSHDFGKDIIPTMLQENHQMYAYRFDGYWKDVGTVESYWKANMDLLYEGSGLISEDKNWRIYTHDSNLPPQYISQKATVKDSLINSGCFIYGNIEHSILFKNVRVEEGSMVKQSIIHPGVTIEGNCILERVIIMENTQIPEGTIMQISEDKEPLVVNEEILGAMLAPAGGDK
ncbi:glucose-1-phosphate adenylyltransferase [Oceanobacillus massiliensis]|uniref:glucose-1-phosphate adenylyltransferase n=1 Tax=Oceanobacillus massiliensis TaxID=1465765 RepID=UPI000287C2F5|nr:glucose-1-phosphate adenylyltransferase [Oceanobacillus massiliensis]